jgi:serine/threonine-protein kinase HipA
MPGQLAIWLHGIKVAIVEEDRHRLRLTYTPEALTSFPAGTPLLSLKLPLSADRYPNGLTRTFLDGLLPEGDPRRAIAEDFGLRADDTFGLAQALGRDCAGALVIQPDDEPAPPQPTILTAEPLAEEALARLVDNLRDVPLGADRRVRISLAGVQEKLVLTRMPDGSWGRPVGGTPTTHILKPEIRTYPNTVENEAFCMRLAKHLGLRVAGVETTTIAGRRLIVVARYDRQVDPSGAVRRLHQEDFCQATGTPPRSKYQEDGGPSLRQIAGILRSVDPDGMPELLQAITLHVVVGNGDAHAKNFSLLHEQSGALRLAPMYDVMSTLYYGDDRLAMYVDDVHRTARVTVDRLVNEAASWGMPRARSAEVVRELLSAVPEASRRAQQDTPDLPADIPQLVAAQLERLLRNHP